jgi:hypothetical protein
MTSGKTAHDWCSKGTLSREGIDRKIQLPGYIKAVNRG